MRTAPVFSAVVFPQGTVQPSRARREATARPLSHEHRWARAGHRPAAWLWLGLLMLAPLGTTQAARDEAAVAQATGSGPLETTIAVEKLQIEKGLGDDEYRHWIPAQRLSAGDEIHYTVRVRNPGKTPVSDIVVTKRLPFGVRYQLGSASWPACEMHFSADGGKTFTPASPGPGASGSKSKKGPRKAPTADYTHVRWVLSKPLAPGATALLRFRATFS